MTSRDIIKSATAHIRRPAAIRFGCDRRGSAKRSVSPAPPIRTSAQAHDARSLRELWHLRAEVYNAVAIQFNQYEAEQRLSRLNRHFPTRAPRATAVLKSRAMMPKAVRPIWALASAELACPSCCKAARTLTSPRFNLEPFKVRRTR